MDLLTSGSLEEEGLRASLQIPGADLLFSRER